MTDGKRLYEAHEQSALIELREKMSAELKMLSGMGMDTEERKNEEDFILHVLNDIETELLMRKSEQ